MKRSDVVVKEIGGYIEFNESLGKEYHIGAIPVNSARHCLEYLIKAKRITKIYLPYFLCSSVSDLCKKCNCNYEYYNIDEQLRPVFNKKIKPDEYLYFVNYYGQFDNSMLSKYSQAYKNIIIDNTQAFFQKPLKSVDTIYTCRKFFGVSDGGYLYTDSTLDEEIPLSVSYNRMEYILGRFEKDASSFYKQSVENNESFSNEPLAYMSKLTHNLLKTIDYKYVKKKRTENFSFLHKHLKKINLLSLNCPKGAFMYPLYIENGKELKKKLIENKIYVPTLWPDVFNIAEEQTLEWKFAQDIVPLPVDQRYSIGDMRYILELIDKIERNIL